MWNDGAKLPSVGVWREGLSDAFGFGWEGVLGFTCKRKNGFIITGLERYYYYVFMCCKGFILLIAYQALSTGKRHLKGTDEYKILKDLMKATYKVQDKS